MTDRDPPTTDPQPPDRAAEPSPPSPPSPPAEPSPTISPEPVAWPPFPPSAPTEDRPPEISLWPEPTPDLTEDERPDDVTGRTLGDNGQPLPPRRVTHRRRIRSRHRRPRWGRKIARGLLFVLGLLLILAVVALFPALSARSNLQGAATEMLAAREALLSRDATGAADAFRRAEELFVQAKSNLDNPAIQIAGWLPILGRNPDTLVAMADAGHLAAGAGRVITEAADSLPGGLTSLVPRDGAIPVDPIRTMAGPLERAGRMAGQAVEIMAGTPGTWLLGPVSAARQRFLPVLEEDARAVEVAAELSDVLPSFLGDGETRRYFFAAQNPAELRGTGGFLGAFTIMKVKDGKITLGQFETIQRLPSLDPSEVDPPNPSYAIRYDRYGGAGFWHNINMTPDFPSAALAIENLYRETVGVKLDGTIVADPFALAALLQVTGPVQVPGTDDTVTPSNVVDYVTNAAYGDLPDSLRKRVLGDVARVAFEGFLQGPGESDVRQARPPRLPGPLPGRPGRIPGQTVPPGTQTPGVGAPSPPTGTQPGRGRPAFPPRTGGRRGGADLYVRAFTAFQETVAGGHVLFHSAIPATQRAFEEAGIAGAMAGGTLDYLAVVANNAAANKVDFYAERAVDYRVELGAEGAAVGHATVQVRNEAPKTGPRYVLGPHDERFRRSENVSILSTYCATSCLLEEFEQQGRPETVGSQIELGYPVYTSTVRVPAGGRETLGYRWSLNRGWEGDASSGVYRLTFVGQSTVRPTTLSLDIGVPDGMRISGTSPGMQVEGGRATWTGEATDRMVFEVRFERSPLGRVWQAVLDFLGQPVIRFG